MKRTGAKKKSGEKTKKTRMKMKATGRRMKKQAKEKSDNASFPESVFPWKISRYL